MKTFNHTGFTLEQIKSFQYLGRTINKWRGRTIALYQHPGQEAKVISWGRTFDGEMQVICTDDKSDWKSALDYAKEGKVLTTE